MRRKLRIVAALTAFAALGALSVGVEAQDGEPLTPSSCSCRSSMPMPRFNAAFQLP